MSRSIRGSRAVYLDTGIAIRFIEDRSQTYRDLLDLVRIKVATEHWLCYLSEFAIMEMYDQFQKHQQVLQELRHGELVSTIWRRLGRRPLTRSGFLKAQRKVDRWWQTNSSLLVVAPPDPYGVTEVLLLASTIAQHSHVATADSVHLSLALLLGCDILLTTDEVFMREINSCLSNLRTKFGRETVGALARITGTATREIKSTADSEGRIVAAYNADGFLRAFGA
jgi:predicted nucleic acid-binding protein